jgi:hypothetical protein
MVTRRSAASSTESAHDTPCLQTYYQRAKFPGCLLSPFVVAIKVTGIWFNPCLSLDKSDRFNRYLGS